MCVCVCVCVCVCPLCVVSGRLAPAPRFAQMVTEGKEAFGLAEILYCCLSPDKKLLISRLDKHNNTIESDSAAVGEGGCLCASLYKQMFCGWVWLLCVCVCACVCVSFVLFPTQ